MPKGRPGRSAMRSKRGPRVPRWALIAGVAAAVLTLAAVVWAVSRDGEDAGDSVAIEHVHGLGINPADGMLYAAAHNGVFGLPEGGPVRRVGDKQQDTMGFTIAGPNHFLASGHPGPGQGVPPHLGLIESTDGGLTWATLSLAGTADFHALRFRHGIVYGYNSTTGKLMTSRDRTTWETRATMTLRDFVISPSNPDVLLATTQAGVQRSTDGGRTWTPAGGPPLLLLDWDRDDRLWGVTAAGDVLRSADGGTTWAPAGKLPAAATAFTAHGDDLYASVLERGILRSRDAGITWTQKYP